MLFKPQMMSLLYALRNQYKIIDSKEIEFFVDLKNLVDKRKSEILKLGEDINVNEKLRRHQVFYAIGKLKQIIAEGKYYHKDKLLLTRGGYVVGLNLYNWGLTEIPESIGNLKHLQALDLSYSQFKTLPESMEKLSSLKNLSLNSNFNLETIPNPIRNLSKNLFIKKYVKRGLAPKEALALALLEVLSGEVMEEFPEGKKLWELEPVWHHYKVNKNGDISEICLHQSEVMHIVLFPNEICTLKNLEVLYLLDHWIKTIPPCISRLKKLRILDLSFNNIKSMPSSIKEIKTLEDFKMT